MELQQAAAYRQSIRAFKAGASLEAGVLEEMIAFAQQAPSWKNSQTGRYYAVSSPEMMAAVYEALPPFNQNSSAQACAYIVTTFEKGISGCGPDGSFVNEVGDGWGAYDLGLQNAYLLLKGAELGVDTLVMGIRDGEALRKVLDIPASQEVVAVIAVGYREKTPAKNGRKLMEEIAKMY